MSAQQVRQMLLLFLLVIGTWQDLKRREIFVLFPVGGTAACILVTAVCRDISIVSVGAGILIGALMIALSFLTHGEIGSGDGWILCACGASLGLLQTVVLLTTAMFLSMAVSAFLLLVRKKKKTDSIPFLPFLLAAWICMTVSASGI